MSVMRAAIAAVFLLSLWSGQPLAQSLSILGAFEVTEPGLVVALVKEETNPPQCLSVEKPHYCFQAIKGAIPVYSLGMDAAGNSYALISMNPASGNAAEAGFFIQRVTPLGTVSQIGRILGKICVSADCVSEWKKFVLGLPQFNVTEGQVLFAVAASTCSGPEEFLSCGDTHIGLVRLSGLPQMFDTLLTFVPGGQAITALTPAHPDGFRSADVFQVWAGDVQTLPDWSQMSPVACLAASHPTAGQLVRAVDTLPDPGPGQARYYLVASQSGVERRLGRQYIDATFSAREPAGLPACQ